MGESVKHLIQFKAGFLQLEISHVFFSSCPAGAFEMENNYGTHTNFGK